MELSTKQKGDIGLASVVLELTKLGYPIAMPMSEHLPYDLIVDVGGKLLKIQVKYRCTYRSEGNIINVPCHTTHQRKRGNVVGKYTLSSFDIMAVFCPCTGKVYYIRVDELLSRGTAMTLRVTTPRLSASGVITTPISYAKDYESLPKQAT